MIPNASVVPGPGSTSTSRASRVCALQPLDGALAEQVGRRDHDGRAGDVDRLERVGVAHHRHVDALVLEHPGERLGAARVGVGRVQRAARAGRRLPATSSTATAATSPATISSVARCRRATSRSRSTRQRVVELEDAHRLRGRGRPVAVPHRVEERGGAVDPLPLPGMRGADGDRDLVRGRAGEVVEQAALDLADGERAEAVDDRVARSGPRASARSARSRSSRAVTVSSVRTALRLRATRAVRRARDSSSPSPIASARNATMASERRQRRRVGRGVDGAVDEPVEPVQQLLEEVAVVVLRADQLALEQRSGLVPRRVERRLRHDAVIPAWVISSTSYASLRIRWSRYCSEVTAAVNGAVNAAATTDPIAERTTTKSGANCAGHHAGADDLGGEAEREGQHPAGDLDDQQREDADPEGAPELLAT